MIATHIGALLIVTGLLTMGAIAFLLLPTTMVKLVFGVTAPDVVTRTIMQHWGLVVCLIGALLVFASYHPVVRVPIMVAAATEKLALGALILASPLRRRWLPVMMGLADAVMACV